MKYAPIPFSKPRPVADPALVKQAQKLVSTTFFGAILKQMRESPFKTKLTGGGAGGESYTTMLDQHLADKMARGAGTKLVDSIVRKLAKNAYDAQQKNKPGKSDQDRFGFNIHGAMQALKTTRRSHVPAGR